MRSRLLSIKSYLFWEWPRSDGSREHSQAKSCRSSPPMSFLFVDRKDDRLIGHARICLLPNRPTSCWIESVIIAKDLRGKGLGKELMHDLEAAAKEFGFGEAFLSTEDQVTFYEHCGYLKCEPILHSTTATSVFPVSSKLEKVLQATSGNSETKCPIDKNGAKVDSPELQQTNVPQPPPPPPLCFKAPSSTRAREAPVSTLGHQYMYKRLT